MNDWQWAENPDAHQGGFYVPHQDRDNTKFFPGLVSKQREPGEPVINEAFFNVNWVDVAGMKKARLVHYTSKGQETHLTGVPKASFSGLAPASFVVLARHTAEKETGAEFSAMVVNSDSPSLDYLRRILGFPSDFLSGFFKPAQEVKALREASLGFIEQALTAFRDGKLAQFSAAHGVFPTTQQMAKRAQAEYLAANGISSLDPFALQAPGNTLMTISRDIEYRIFKEHELRARSLELIAVILGTDPAKASVESVLRAIVTEFPRIDKVLLSAGQQRKSRAGYSFENHISRMLRDGRIPFEEQAILEAKRRPDFVLPSMAVFRSASRDKKDALVLSAKTTLRERWKQVSAEIRNCDLYLATVDERIAGNAIEDMSGQGIKLVVPESLKKSGVTTYEKYKSVITFTDFFSDDVKKQRFPKWKTLGCM